MRHFVINFETIALSGGITKIPPQFQYPVVEFLVEFLED